MEIQLAKSTSVTEWVIVVNTKQQFAIYIYIYIYISRCTRTQNE